MKRSRREKDLRGLVPEGTLQDLDQIQRSLGMAPPPDIGVRVTIFLWPEDVEPLKKIGGGSVGVGARLGIQRILAERGY